MSKTKNKRESATGNKPTLVAFLLDRSGSMADNLEETIKGFNSYVAGLRKDGTKGSVFTLTQFDSEGIDIVHNAVPFSKIKDLEFRPRSWTPLYDAIGKTIRATEKANKKGKYKVLFVTLTDGLENASREWNSGSIRELIKQKEKDGWTFADIAVGKNAWAQMTDLRAGTIGASNVLRTTRGATGQSYRDLHSVTASFMCSTSHTGGASAKNLFAGATSAVENTGDEETE